MPASRSKSGAKRQPRAVSRGSQAATPQGFLATRPSRSEVMAEILQQPLETPAAWRGSDFAADPSWIYVLEKRVITELEANREAVHRSGKTLFEVRAEDFPLPSFDPLRRELQDQLEGGHGFALIRGLPAEDCSEDDAALLFWGLGVHLGAPEEQDRAGNLLHHVRDTGQDLRADDVRKYQTNQEIPFHNDGSDIFMLLCLRNARQGGRSRLVSATTVFNEIVRRRPDLAAVLQQPFYFDARGQQAPGEPRYQKLPVFHYYAGFLSVLHKRFYIDLAQRFPEVPPLTSEQVEALDLMDDVCEEPGVSLDFETLPGDILVANNYEIVHSRTAFEDHSQPERRRHMLRLWLTIPNGRPLPPVFETTREFRHSYTRRKRAS